MTTSENKKLFDLYVVTYEICSTHRDVIENFYEFFDKQTEKEIQKRIFQTPGYKVYISQFDVWFKGDIIGPIDEYMVNLINRALYLNSNNRSWVKPTGTPNVTNESFKSEITVKISEKKVKEIIIT